MQREILEQHGKVVVGREFGGLAHALGAHLIRTIFLVFVNGGDVIR